MIYSYDIKAIKRGEDFGYIIKIQAEELEEAIIMAQLSMRKMFKNINIDITQYKFSFESKCPVIVEINPLQIINKP